MLFLYYTESAMFRFRCRSGISDYKTFLNLLLLKNYFPAYFCQLRFVSFYIRYKMGRFRFGGKLRGLQSKLLIDTIIKMH